MFFSLKIEAKCVILLWSIFYPMAKNVTIHHPKPGRVATAPAAEINENISPATKDVEFDFSEDTFTFGAAVPTTGNMKNSSSSSDVAIEIPKELHPPKITTAEREKRGPSKFKGKRNLKLNTEENAFGDPKLKIR